MESINLSADELSTLEANLQEYAPAQIAINQIKASEGDLNLALESMLVEEFGPQPTFANRSLWEGRVRRRCHHLPLPSEPCLRLTPHTAQANRPSGEP